MVDKSRKEFSEMDNNKTNQLIRDMIETQIAESGLSEEEVIEPSMLSFVYQYFNGELKDDEILYILNELGYECDMPLLREKKEKRAARLAKRKVKKEYSV